MPDDIPDLVSAEHTRAVGLLVLAISEIESRITDFLASVLKLNIDDAIAAFQHQQGTGRIDTLTALLDSHLRKADQAQSAQYGHIFAILQKAKNLAEYRNTVVHALWITGEGGHSIPVRFSVRGGFRKGRLAHEVEDILERVREAIANAQSLASLAVSFRK